MVVIQIVNIIKGKQFRSVPLQDCSFSYSKDRMTLTFCDNYCISVRKAQPKSSGNAFYS